MAKRKRTEESAQVERLNPRDLVMTVIGAVEVEAHLSGENDVPITTVKRFKDRVVELMRKYEFEDSETDEILNEPVVSAVIEHFIEVVADGEGSFLLEPDEYDVGDVDAFDDVNTDEGTEQDLREEGIHVRLKR